MICIRGIWVPVGNSYLFVIAIVQNLYTGSKYKDYGNSFQLAPGRMQSMDEEQHNLLHEHDSRLHDFNFQFRSN